MGDSGSYIWTALSGWIPPDRSFLYGYVIRWTSLLPESLTSLLIVQTFAGALTAILVVLICRTIFKLPPLPSYCFGLVSALDPLQLVWERYVMTETLSLLLYAAMLFIAFSYLARPRLWQIAVVQLLGLLLIAFRISYLLVVQADAVLLPLIAFFPPLYMSFRSKSPNPSRSLTLKRLGLHLGTSLILMFALHAAYQRTNGALSERPPAYLYSSGFSVLASWAPTLRPDDSPDPRLGQIIAQGDKFHLSDMRLRNSQLYSPGYLIARWKNEEPDLAMADRVARQTALHSLLRRPLGVFALGARTFLSYFDTQQLHRQAKSDLGKPNWPAPAVTMLASHFRNSPPLQTGGKAETILQRYFLRAEPYYYAALLAPLFGGSLFFFLRKGYVAVLFCHGGIFLATNSLLAVTASVRYLQPMSLLTILIAGGFVELMIDRRTRKTETVTA